MRTVDDLIARLAEFGCWPVESPFDEFNVLLASGTHSVPPPVEVVQECHARGAEIRQWLVAEDDKRALMVHEWGERWEMPED